MFNTVTDNDIMRNVLEIPIKVRVTDKDLEDILLLALEVGISYWCRQYDRTGKFGITLYHVESDDKWSFDKRDLLRGIEQYIASEKQWSILNTDNYGVYVDTALVDAYVADTIIQYACMGKVVFS